MLPVIAKQGDNRHRFGWVIKKHCACRLPCLFWSDYNLSSTFLGSKYCFFREENENGTDFAKELVGCSSLKDIFELVKDSVKTTLKQSRAGLDIGLAELGNAPNGLLGAFYPVGSNIIVVNATPLKRIMETEPKLFRPYLFATLLHEYVHSLGYFDEASARKISYMICRKIFGEDHPATQISRDMRTFFPYLLYPGGHPASNRMEVVQVEDVDYIG